LANATFPALFPKQPTPEAPNFERLDPVRKSQEAGSKTPTTGVAKLTIPATVSKTDAAAAEAVKIAVYIKAEVAAGRRRYGDFLILNRGRPRLGLYAQALEQQEIPVEVSGAGMFLASPEVATLRLLLRCLSDPLDSLALVGVLRGPLFGVSDRQLFAYRRAGGRFELTAPVTSMNNHAAASNGEHNGSQRCKDSGQVCTALKRLHELYRLTRTLPSGAAVEQIVDETGLLALAATTADGAGAGNLLQAVDRVRRVSELGGSLADAAEAIDENAPLSTEIESLPIEPGRQDVVRVMNLHKAKGLEAAVVFLSDPCNGFSFPPNVRVVRDGSQAIGFMKIESQSEESFAKRLIGIPAGWDTHEDIEQRYRDAEITRLLYVASTRARDLLVIGQCDKAGNNKAWNEFSSYLASCPELVRSQSPMQEAERLPDVSDAVRARAAADRDERTRHLLRASWAVTRVTDEAREYSAAMRIREAVIDEPGMPAAIAADDASLLRDTSSHHADAGYAWGLLIHGLLEHAIRRKDVARSDLERLAVWLTIEFPDLRPHIGKAIEIVQQVSKAEFWREAQESSECHVEAPFAVTRSGTDGITTIVHGVIDLVYRAATGWKILDYKTDQATHSSALVTRYRNQIEQYAHAWSGTTGAGMPGSALFFVRTGQRLEIDSEQIPAHEHVAS
jgi:ATP-dependent helicase/nuclease subunit A